jgi:hypothetical protein
MPAKQHVRGVGSKEQRQYELIKKSAQKSGRYGKRAKEVAARTVLKHPKERGHKKGHERAGCDTEVPQSWGAAAP